MRNLTAYEVAAMWFYHDDYAKSGLGAIEYFKCLSDNQKELMKDMVSDIVKAAKLTNDKILR